MKKLLVLFLLVFGIGLHAQTKEELQRQKVLLQDNTVGSIDIIA